MFGDFLTELLLYSALVRFFCVGFVLFLQMTKLVNVAEGKVMMYFWVAAYAFSTWMLTASVFEKLSFLRWYEGVLYFAIGFSVYYVMFFMPAYRIQGNSVFAIVKEAETTRRISAEKQNKMRIDHIRVNAAWWGMMAYGGFLVMNFIFRNFTNSFAPMTAWFQSDAPFVYWVFVAYGGAMSLVSVFFTLNMGIVKIQQIFWRKRIQKDLGRKVSTEELAKIILEEQNAKYEERTKQMEEKKKEKQQRKRTA